MYFLWKRTPHGSIRVSCDGFSDFINRVLSGKSKCRSLCVAEGETAAMTLVLSSNNNAAMDTSESTENKEIEKGLADILSPLGFSSRVVWTDRGAPGADLNENIYSACQSPWTWMLVVALITLKFMAGWKGLFWTLFWGTAAWFVSRVVIALAKRRKMGPPPPLVRR